MPHTHTHTHTHTPSLIWYLQLNLRWVASLKISSPPAILCMEKGIIGKVISEYKFVSWLVCFPEDPCIEDETHVER